MYAQVREPTAQFVTAQGRTASGERRELSIRVLADTDDPLVAQSRMQQLVSDSQLDSGCAAIATRSRDLDDVEVIAIEIVSVTHNIFHAATNPTGQVGRIVLEHCEVPRP